MKPQFYFMTHLGKGNKIKVERVHIPGRHPGIGLWILVYIQSQDFKPTPVNTHVFTPLQSSNPGVSNSRTAISYPNVFTWIGSRDYPNSWLVKNRYNGINKKREISGSNYTFTTPAPGDVFEERKLMTLPQKFLECLKRARSTQSSSELDILSNELQSQRDTWYGIGVTRSLDIAWNDSDPRVTAYHIRDTLQSRLYGKRGTPSSLIDILERKNSLERRLLKRSIGRSLTIDEFIAEQHIRIKEEKVVVISQK